MPSRRQQLRLSLLRILAAATRPWKASRSRRLTSSPRVLLIRPDHIGDLLFATPAIHDLKTAVPGAHATVMVGPWGEPVLERNPWVDERLTCEFPGFSRQPKRSWLAPYQMVLEWADLLRSQSFDIAVILRFDHWWGALLAYLADIPYRVGYALPECQPFLTHAIPYDHSQHEVVQNRTLVAQVPLLCGQTGDEPGRTATAMGTPPLEFPVREEDVVFAKSYLADRGVSGSSPLVIVHPGAGAPVKQWRPEGYAAVADELARRWQASIVITGSRSELDLAWTVAAHMDADPLIASGETTVAQLAALYQLSQLVIGPDCGPLHLAVAMGTPTVHLYGPVDPVKFGPWGPVARHRVLVGTRDCIPCNRLDYSPAEVHQHPCVTEIPVGAVLDAAEQLREKRTTPLVG